MSVPPVFRFAPSPNGYLHLGHALSAILNFDAAQRSGGRFLLRIEDIDTGRTREEFVQAIEEDLAWLGLRWEQSVRRQSAHFGEYAQRLDMLRQQGLVYPCNCTRGAIGQAVAEREKSGPWPRDPDGAPLYPGACRTRQLDGEGCAWRLDMRKALASMDRELFWREQDESGAIANIAADPSRWGDVILARKDFPASYHLAVVHDDALQGITHVIRGADLREATAIHRLLQNMLGLPAPIYRHHALVRDAKGDKLSKSLRSTALRELRAQGVTPAQIRQRLGLPGI